MLNCFGLFGKNDTYAKGITLLELPKKSRPNGWQDTLKDYCHKDQRLSQTILENSAYRNTLTLRRLADLLAIKSNKKLATRFVISENADTLNRFDLSNIYTISKSNPNFLLAMLALQKNGLINCEVLAKAPATPNKSYYISELAKNSEICQALINDYPHLLKSLYDYQANKLAKEQPLFKKWQQAQRADSPQANKEVTEETPLLTP